MKNNELKNYIDNKFKSAIIIGDIGSMLLVIMIILALIIGFTVGIDYEKRDDCAVVAYADEVQPYNRPWGQLSIAWVDVPYVAGYVEDSYYGDGTTKYYSMSVGFALDGTNLDFYCFDIFATNYWHDNIDLTTFSSGIVKVDSSLFTFNHGYDIDDPEYPPYGFIGESFYYNVFVENLVSGDISYLNGLTDLYVRFYIDDVSTIISDYQAPYEVAFALEVCGFDGRNIYDIARFTFNVGDMSYYSTYYQYQVYNYIYPFNYGSYSVGVADANAQGNFVPDLLGSIFNVPLDFIGNMFNFNIFGVNVSSFVLLILSGIIIFGIMRFII